jgi:DNA replicative helicase MCM subunit Mcm2 (Cdc46/Mcm family)
VINVVGVYMTTIATGFQAGRRDRLFHETFVDAFRIEKDKQNFREFMLSDEMMAKVDELQQSN